MSLNNGLYKILYIKSDSVYFPIGCLISNSFSESVEMLGTTTRENTDGWKSSIPTLQEYSISFDGLITFDDRGETVITYAEIKALKRARTKIEWKIMSNLGGDTDEGTGYIVSLGDSATIDEYTSFNGEIVGFGIPTITAGTVIPSPPDIEDMIPPYDEAKED